MEQWKLIQGCNTNKINEYLIYFNRKKGKKKMLTGKCKHGQFNKLSYID